MSTILIVDDLQTEREWLGRMVLATGNKPEFANDGEEALSKARTVKPALILLDVVMPKLDGFSACRRLKNEPETAGIPVVLITLKGSPSDLFWGKQQGADDHLVKPLDPTRIKQVISRYAH